MTPPLPARLAALRLRAERRKAAEAELVARVALIQERTDILLAQLLTALSPLAGLPVRYLSSSASRGPIIIHTDIEQAPGVELYAGNNPENYLAGYHIQYDIMNGDVWIHRFPDAEVVTVAGALDHAIGLVEQHFDDYPARPPKDVLDALTAAEPDNIDSNNVPF